ADAHIRSGAIASDYRAAVTRAPRAAITPRIYQGDRALGLVVARGHVVSVPAPSGAPLLRVDARRARRSVVWHDPRLRRRPARRPRGRWLVPLVVDGRPARLEGTIWRVPAPRPWPWLALAAPFVLAAAAARHRPATAARATGGCAALSTAVVAVAFGAAGSA